jgi:hypothetical protein
MSNSAGEVNRSASVLPSTILAGTGDIPWLNFGIGLSHE